MRALVYPACYHAWEFLSCTWSSLLPSAASCAISCLSLLSCFLPYRVLLSALSTLSPPFLYSFVLFPHSFLFFFLRCLSLSSFLFTFLFFSSPPFPSSLLAVRRTSLPATCPTVPQPTPHSYYPHFSSFILCSSLSPFLPRFPLFLSSFLFIPTFFPPPPSSLTALTFRSTYLLVYKYIILVFTL